VDAGTWPLVAGLDLLKRTKPMDLRAALLDVLRGGAPMTSQIARRVIESFRRKARARDESVKLSVREEQILLLLSQGYPAEAFQPQLHTRVSPPDSSWLSARVPSCERSFLFLPELKLTSSRRMETRWHTRIIKLVYG
jgi:hypothetical protein